MTILAASLLLTQGTIHASLPGGYIADFSNAKGSKGVFQAVFANRRLRIRSNGEFTLAGLRMSGFWRVSNGRAVLVFGEFFGKPYAEPDAFIKRRWPDNHIRGLVLTIRSDGTLVLPRFGVAEGPVVFRKAKPRGFPELLRLSDSADPTSAEGEDAWIETADRAKTDWREFLRTLRAPSVPFSSKVWGLYFFKSLPSEGISTACKWLSMPALGRDEKERRIWWLALSHNLADVANRDAAKGLVDGFERLKLDKSTVAKAVGVARYQEAKPLLLHWINSPHKYDRARSLDALASLGAADALLDIRKATSDEEPLVRIAAWSAVLKVSQDSAEREGAIRNLAGLWDKAEFSNMDILEAWGDSGSKSAIPYLANVLLNSKDTLDQMRAAEALGELGMREAIPALLEAKDLGSIGSEVGSDPEKAMVRIIESWANYADVHKAVAEALFKLQHPMGALKPRN